MNLELLSHLRICTKKNWFEYYTEVKTDHDQAISSQALYQLTRDRLQQISSATVKSLNKPKIILAEADPLKFLAAFLAGIISEAHIFLCNPEWQQQEWQQVLELVGGNATCEAAYSLGRVSLKPDLVFGEQRIQHLIIKLRTITLGEKSAIAIKPNKQKYNLAEQSLIMIPTGGSSGKIKFAMHKWSTLTASVTGFQNYFGCQQINSFCTLPLYHVSGLMQFVRSFITQGNLFICPYQLVKIQPITITNQASFFISLVPTQLQFLIKLIPNWLAQFKTILLGGAPASRSLLELARKYRLPLAPTYGMTETASQIVTLKPEDFLAGNNSSGRVLSHAKINIVPESKQISNNPIGLIQISGDSLCLGYYPHLRQSSALATDDLGYFDQAGYLYLIGRNSQKIITGGENVFPSEVEAAIWATKLVKDVCVVGMTDKTWGQVVTAIYVPVNIDQDLNLIKEKTKIQLAKYKQPKNWIQVEIIPRNNRDKIDYQQIKAMAQNYLGLR